jgi:hypothetical protein
MEAPMRHSHAKTATVAGMRPVAVTVLTIAGLVSILLVTSVASNLSPRFQPEAYRYGITVPSR